MNEGFFSEKDVFELGIVLIFLLILFSIIILVTPNNETVINNTIIEDYADAETIYYNPMTKTYSFGNHSNLTKEQIINKSFIN